MGNEIWAGVVAVILANVVLIGYVVAAVLETGEDSRLAHYQKDGLYYKDDDYVADELIKEKVN